MRQLVENSRTFNGENHAITLDAQTILVACFEKFAAVTQRVPLHRSTEHRSLFLSALERRQINETRESNQSFVR